MTDRTDHAFIDWIPPDSRFPPPGYDDLLERRRATARQDRTVAHLCIDATTAENLVERLEGFWDRLMPGAGKAGVPPLTRKARRAARLDARKTPAEDETIAFLRHWFAQVAHHRGPESRQGAPVICVAAEPAGFCAIVIGHDGPEDEDPASPLAREQIATMAAVVMHLLRKSSGRPCAREADIESTRDARIPFRIPTTHVAPVALIPSPTDRQVAARHVSTGRLSWPEALAERLLTPRALFAEVEILREDSRPTDLRRTDASRATAVAALADRYRRVLAQHIDHLETHRPEAARQGKQDQRSQKVVPESDRIRREIEKTVTWWRWSAIVFVGLAALFIFGPDIWQVVPDALAELLRKLLGDAPVELLRQSLGDRIPSAAAIPRLGAGDLGLFSIAMVGLAVLQWWIVTRASRCFERPERPLARLFARRPCRWLAIIFWPAALAGAGVALLHWTPLARVPPPALPGDAGIAHFRDTLAAIVWLLPILGTWALVQASLSFTRTQEEASSSGHRHRLLDRLGVIAAQGGALARTTRTAFRLDDPRLAPGHLPVAAMLFDEGHWAGQLARQRARLDALRETARSSFQRSSTNTAIIVAAIGMLGPLGSLAPGFNEPPPTLALVTERLGLEEIRTPDAFLTLKSEAEEQIPISTGARDNREIARACLAERVKDHHKGADWPSDARVKAWAGQCGIPLHEPWPAPATPVFAKQTPPQSVTLVQMFVTPPPPSEPASPLDWQQDILAALHEIAENTQTGAALDRIARGTAGNTAALQQILTQTEALAALPAIAADTTALAAGVDALRHRETDLTAWLHQTGAMADALLHEIRLLHKARERQDPTVATTLWPPLRATVYPAGCSRTLASVHFDTGGAEAAQITGIRIEGDEMEGGIGALRTHLSETLADPEERLFVLGHADGQGSAVANFELSKARAQTIATLLDPGHTRLAAAPQGVGELGWMLDGRPIAHDDDHARRVDLIRCAAAEETSTDLAEAAAR